MNICIPRLQTARFRQFWDEAAKSRNILEVVPGELIARVIQFFFFFHIYGLKYVGKLLLLKCFNEEAGLDIMEVGRLNSILVESF